MNKTLREQYFANEILKIGDIVEDSDTGENLKIIDRGSNYITVDGPSGVVKKWLNEVKAIPESDSEDDFSVLESGQVKLFGYETKNFYSALSDFIVEQFSEFDDLYSKHQIIKLLDKALGESNIHKQYELLEKVTHFYETKKIDPPIIIEGMKSEIERRCIVEILATVAGSPVNSSPYQTAVDAMSALKKRYTMYSQWQVLFPILKLAKNAGIPGIMQNMPFTLNKSDQKSESTLHEELVQILEDNFEEFCSSVSISEYAYGEAIKEPGTKTNTSSGTQSITKKIADMLIQDKLSLPENLRKTTPEEDTRRKFLVSKLTQHLIPKVKEFQNNITKNIQSPDVNTDYSEDNTCVSK